MLSVSDNAIEELERLVQDPEAPGNVVRVVAAGFG